MNKQNGKSQYEKMTQTPISSLIIQLSIPTIISMLVTNIYNMADTAFVGKLGTVPAVRWGSYLDLWRFCRR